MSDLIDTTEMYLRTIFELEEEGIRPLRARIAERLGHSGPTVSQTVSRMERDGLLHVGEDRRIELSPEGRAVATRVMRKHRLAERLLVDVIGLEWEYAHDEACRWEHVMSEQVERKIVALLGDRHESPYGNPIPGLAELESGPMKTSEGAPSLPDRLVTLVTLAGDGGGNLGTIRRIGEPVQVDPESLALLEESGVLPGAPVSAVVGDDGVIVTSAGRESLLLPTELALHVYAERRA